MAERKNNGNETVDTFAMAALAANIAESKKAVETVMLETAQVSYLADYFVICSAESTTQIRTIADEVEKRFKALGYSPIGRENTPGSKWALLDYGDIVVHVMSRAEREFYQLEHFWSHANVVNAQDWLRDDYRQLMAS